MKCPNCGTEANGAFCSKCGTRLQAANACARCGGRLEPGARFCSNCGAGASSGRAFRWAVPAALVVLALAGGFWLGARDENGTRAPVALSPASPAGGVGAAPGAPPPLTGSMRDQADRLFERIMQSRARGDTADAQFFLPMALQAYEGAEPLDADGLFHVGLLQLEGGRVDEALATADRISAGDEDHLFGLAVRGEAALAAGDETAARSAFSAFLAAFDAQVARGLPEYEMHRPALDEYREQARRVTGG